MALQIRFGVSTWLWTSPFETGSIDDIFSKAADIGFDAVEIAVEDPALIDEKAVKDALRIYGLRAVVCGAFGPSRDLTHEDPQVHKECLKYIEACLGFAASWDAGFFAGPMYSAVGKARMVSEEQRRKEWELAVNNLRKVCDIAAQRGLQIAIEPLNRFESDLVNTAADAARMIKDINHASAKIVLDGFHMNIEEPNIEQAIVTAGADLIHVQVSENYRGTPGTGQTRWDDYRRGLEKINYRGTVSIESFTPGNKELAGAVCIWKPLASSQDAFASEGFAFLKKWATQ